MGKIKLEDLKIGTPVWILWVDILGIFRNWTSVNNYDFRADEHAMRHRSIGFITKVTKEAIFIHQSETVKRFKGGDRTVTEGIAIPLGAILRWGFAKMEVPA